MSLPAYLLVARSQRSSRVLEAAVKYFFAGGVAGALFMLGQAGATLMAAALFKLGAFPLNWWLPDAYEAAAPKVAKSKEVLETLH
ncbi:MAG: hypothetical protein COV48_02185 [Elusimicrobia bacterium CG11_big_fil_rev_8_21_14_0_20_64_6]|nr:MAG: hypothetical protein COV48_02185 [Elusimicrobia bacterium CG11_big_fil_rev_8_21_14_0_20_64_6]